MATAVSYENQTQSAKIQQLQTDVNGVFVQMKDNLGNIINRGAMLDDLEGKTDDLQYRAEQLQIGAHRVQGKFWCQNIKMWIILITVIVVIIVVLVLALTLTIGKKNK
ncbi:unnamed protein product [Didymodactylos carnosus]|uniref:V-SNARE coiled-coil homology domain-containing protein n=1 Tax=Didymodactylos carnosus TaxID=1234261 RepID=A0A814XE98_9BILA|nr:unnamed protein product [Didymodactylos carnosus]CAF1490828.1 unnamed protein product [Didymodactylos carnosus]CAF3979172.1 unnamed protein product [Didymodactylos carnosus]CAF4280044.1 unnamed protein product [Didymodactylos carnosus]